MYWAKNVFLAILNFSQCRGTTPSSQHSPIHGAVRGLTLIQIRHEAPGLVRLLDGSTTDFDQFLQILPDPGQQFDSSMAFSSKESGQGRVSNRGLAQ
jgi:hypothetical protein